jgi:hypothetical protein
LRPRGFGPWSLKADVPYVRPPAEALLVSVEGCYAPHPPPCFVGNLDFASVELPNGMRWFSEAAQPPAGTAEPDGFAAALGTPQTRPTNPQAAATILVFASLSPPEGEDGVTTPNVKNVR